MLVTMDAATPRAFPDAAVVASLLQRIGERAASTREVGPWESGNFADLAETGCLAGWIAAEDGGTAASEPAIIEFLVSLAACCLTTALALTQWASAVRILSRGDVATRGRFLPDLMCGRQRTTVGISQLTTSRRHLTKPVMAATPTDTGWRLEGLCPWVTGADSVHTLVTGAVVTPAAGGEAEPRFFVVETNQPGVTIEPPLAMLALSGSRTSCVRLTQVEPAAEIVPTAAAGPQTGGLGTTALALGSTQAALRLLKEEATHRDSLAPIVAGLRQEADAVADQLRTATRNGIEQAARNTLRQRANALVTRSAQAALTASKGAGFIIGHPAEQLLRESMFFLVWSCPQPVTDSWLCDLAGLAESLPGEAPQPV